MADIRALRKDDDMTDLIALSRDFFAEYQDHHPDFFDIDELADSDIADFFSRSVAAGNSRTFVAIEGGRMIGYITVAVRGQAPFYKVKKVGAISGLMVHKDHRRRGIAGELLRRAKQFFADQGAVYFTVYTAVGNGPAIRSMRGTGWCRSCPPCSGGRTAAPSQTAAMGIVLRSGPPPCAILGAWKAAHWIAQVTLIGVPPFVLAWVIVHPLVRLWRRAGTALTYLVVGSIVAIGMVCIYRLERAALRIRFGLRWPLVCLAAPSFWGRCTSPREGGGC